MERLTPFPCTLAQGWLLSKVSAASLKQTSFLAVTYGAVIRERPVDLERNFSAGGRHWGGQGRSTGTVL